MAVKRHKKQDLGLAFFLLFLFIAAFGAQLTKTTKAANNTVLVDVNVTQLSELTVTPDRINWTQVSVGTAGGQRNLTLRNTGSVNLTNVHSYTSILENETARPYTSSNPDSYSAGGVLVFRNATDSTFYWSGRLEWNWTTTIQNLVWPSEIDVNSRVAYGFFRNASNSFVWAVGNGTNSTGGASGRGVCNQTGTEFAIEDDIDDGTTNTRSPTVTGITWDGGDQNYSFFSVSRAGNVIDTMCVAVSYACDKIYVYKFDKRANFTNCVNSRHVVNNMVPDDTHNIIADAWVPRGLPSGDLRRVIWTFFAT